MRRTARFCCGGGVIFAPAFWAITAACAQSITIEITQAEPAFDLRTTEPEVAFRMSPASARAFAELTKRNVGRKAAIVIDGRTMSAPIIREPILGGSGQITGDFTPEEARRIAAGLASGTSKMTIEIVPENSDSK
jgi:preprotein translocase subunit SecD